MASVGMKASISSAAMNTNKSQKSTCCDKISHFFFKIRNVMSCSLIRETLMVVGGTLASVGIGMIGLSPIVGGSLLVPGIVATAVGGTIFLTGAVMRGICKYADRKEAKAEKKRQAQVEKAAHILINARSKQQSQPQVLQGTEKNAT